MPSDVAPGERLTFTEESQAVPESAVTVVDGATFAIFGRAGDIAAGSVQGLFVADTRVCSALVLTVDGAPLEALTVVEPTSYSATFVGRTRDRTLLVVREVDVGQGMRLRLKVENLTTERRSVTLALAAEADLAEIFAVKEGRAHEGPAPQRLEPGALIATDADHRRGLVLRPQGTGAHLEEGTVSWALEL